MAWAQQLLVGFTSLICMVRRRQVIICSTYPVICIYIYVVRQMDHGPYESSAGILSHLKATRYRQA
jgi:hypothetical protein